MLEMIPRPDRQIPRPRLREREIRIPAALVAEIMAAVANGRRVADEFGPGPRMSCCVADGREVDICEVDVRERDVTGGQSEGILRDIERCRRCCERGKSDEGEVCEE